MATKLQIRGGTASQWTAANPILADREMGIETDTKKSKYGDGVTAWNALAYNTTSTPAFVVVVTTASPIILNMLSAAEGLFKGSANITGNRTWQLSNAGSAVIIRSIRFQTNAGIVHTFPASFKMSNALWDAVAKTWTPLDAGDYEASATYDGVNWTLKIEGPFN